MELPQKGDRIELLVMPHDPLPMAKGSKGTVRAVVEGVFGIGAQIQVDWDDGRGLNLCCPPDRYRIIERVMD